MEDAPIEKDETPVKPSRARKRAATPPTDPPAVPVPAKAPRARKRPTTPDAPPADTDAEAEHWQSSLYQAFVNLRRGRPSRLPPPQADFLQTLAPEERAAVEETLACSVVGGAARIERGLEAFIAQTGADELIISSMIFDHAARLRSHELTARAFAALARGGAD